MEVLSKRLESRIYSKQNPKRQLRSASIPSNLRNALKSVVLEHHRIFARQFTTLPSVSRISILPKFSFFISSSILLRSPMASTTIFSGWMYFCAIA